MKKQLGLSLMMLTVTAGCAHTRNACWQRKEDTTLTGDYLNCMRDVKLTPRMNACFEDQKKTEPGFHMKIVTAFDVAGDGSVKNVKLDPAEIMHPELAKCMIKGVQDQKFVKHEGPDTHVELPWVFKKETNSLFQF